MHKTVIDNKVNKMKIERKKAERVLDLFHWVNMNELNSITENNVSKYKNSAFTFREIKREIEYAYALLNEGKCLMAVTILRNVFEDLMYFFATGINNNLRITTETKPGELRRIVKENADNYFDGLFVDTDFNDMYEHLSKMVHVTSIKECINYLDSRSRYRVYIATELKYETVSIECMLMQFLSKKGKYRNDLQRDTLMVASTMSIVNAMSMTAVFKHKHNKKIEGFFYDDRSRNYLRSKSQNVVEELQYLNNESDRVLNSVNQSIDNLKEKYILLGYEQKYDDLLKKERQAKKQQHR